MEITPKEVLELSIGQKEVGEEEKHRLLSKIYFETRKALEYMFPKVKKTKKK